MRKNRRKIRCFVAIKLLVVILLTTLIPTANAAIFNSIFGGDKNDIPISENISALTQKSIAMSDNFLTANHSPLKITKPEINTKTTVAKELIITATAYSSTVDQTDHTPFETALGTQVRDGVVAANFLPFGTKIKIPQMFGDKIFVVEDRMNKRYWERVDIWFPDRESAKNFGLKTLKVQILES